jgi:phage baseplate assembly protein V
MQQYTDYGSHGFDVTAENLIRCGTISDRRMTSYGPEVRVDYDDRGVTSAWLPVAQHGSSGTSMHWCPRVGDNVTVLHYPTRIEQGVVLCSTATENNPAFCPRSINAVACQHSDGSYMEYDPDAQCFSMLGVGSIYLHANGDYTMYAGGNVIKSIGGKLTITTGGKIDITAGGQITVKGDPMIQLNGVQINTNGDVLIPGKLTVDGQTLLQGGGTATPSLKNSDGSGGGS